MRKEWSRVVQGLSNFKNNDNSKFKLHKIIYLKGKRNELYIGMINMMNVLIKIFNLDHGKIWKDLKEKDDIVSILEILISIITKNKFKISIECNKKDFEEILEQRYLEVLTFHLFMKRLKPR